MERDEEFSVWLHDLKNIFTIVISSADLVKLDLGETHPNRSDLDNIIDASYRGLGLVDKMREKES